MNARVFLLALVTAAFMAIWDADRPVAGRVKMSRLQNANVPLAKAGLNRSPLFAAQHAGTFQHNAASDSASSKAHTESLIPLPKNLQPGIWQAISRAGDTFRITIERKNSLTGSTEVQRSENKGKNFCVITASDGIRWCFIKEHSKMAQQPSADQR
ncbi:MAG: hypothetical protein DWI22_11410 [Planctomycetota bacterium]|jgi:hypothetical protein|nr:MAG: hypothetical protein DWI22_11410 [Planctomycetota bacterium]